jgi:hypothetical protein
MRFRPGIRGIRTLTTSPRHRGVRSHPHRASPAGEYPIYTVWCYQDLNGDGIHQWPIDRSDLVYAEMRKPSEELTLRGGGSL